MNGNRFDMTQWRKMSADSINSTFFVFFPTDQIFSMILFDFLHELLISFNPIWLKIFSTTKTWRSIDKSRLGSVQRKRFSSFVRSFSCPTFDCFRMTSTSKETKKQRKFRHINWHYSLDFFHFFDVSIKPNNHFINECTKKKPSDDLSSVLFRVRRRHFHFHQSVAHLEQMSLLSSRFEKRDENLFAMIFFCFELQKTRRTFFSFVRRF